MFRKICQDRPTKKFVGRPGGNGRASKIWRTKSAFKLFTMSRHIESQPCSIMPSIGGLLVFLGIRALLQYTFESGQNPRRFMEIQTGQSVGLNLYFNPPTVNPQGQSGSSAQSALPFYSATRFCISDWIWPFIRGRDGPEPTMYPLRR